MINLSAAEKPTAFVIGWPISHSKSPTIHNYWLRNLRIEGDYVPIPVERDQLKTFLEQAGERGYLGGNVTIPHKEAIIPFLDDVDEISQTLGAVNTIWLEHGRWHGTNTDGHGYLQNLTEQIPDWQKTVNQATIIGAGGATRAIVKALANKGVNQFNIVNRTVERAETLLKDLNIEGKVTPLKDINTCLVASDLLINTSSLGMNGFDQLELDTDLLPKHAIVSDIVYAPLRTELLLNAQKSGLRTSDGIGMLLHQAVPGFQHWFKHKPVVDDNLRQLVLNQTSG